MQKIKASTIIIYLAGWLLFLSFPLVFINGARSTGNIFSLLSNSYYWLFCACYIVLFYFNSLYLIPAFFLRKKYFSYFIIILILLNGVYFLQPFDKLLSNGPVPSEINPDHYQLNKIPGMENNYRQGPPPMPPGEGFDPGGPPPNGEHRQPSGDHGPPDKPFHHVDTTSLFIFIMIIALSTSVEITQQWGLTEKRATLAETGKATAELSFLKAQINPHFLFNTLNNIYALAVTNNEHTADSIMKLSNIMRYVTDEISEDFVPLQNELDCINDYIELQRLRIGKKTQIDFTVKGNAANRTIAPLIFMTFVENMFKHGISKQKEYFLRIEVVIEEKSISFFSRNPVVDNIENASRRGIGISNTLQRLEHLYPGKYLLNISNEKELYIVKLTLQS